MMPEFAREANIRVGDVCMWKDGEILRPVRILRCSPQQSTNYWGQQPSVEPWYQCRLLQGSGGRTLHLRQSDLDPHVDWFLYNRTRRSTAPQPDAPNGTPILRPRNLPTQVDNRIRGFCGNVVQIMSHIGSQWVEGS